MTFTYDPTLADTVSQVRFFIGDTTVNAGPRANSTSLPENTNFQDEEITAILTQESGSIDSTVATFLSTLAIEWSALAVSITIGPRKEDLSKIAEMFEKRLLDWKTTHGLLHRAFSSGVIRRSSDANAELTA